MTFQPGQVSNPHGRPKGSRNKRTQDVIDLIQGRGDKDPLDALSELITTSKDPAIVATASNMLAPYLHSKRGAIPQPPEPRFVHIEIVIREAETVTQGRQNLQLISRLQHEGRIPVEDGDRLYIHHTKILDGLIEEAKLAAQGAGDGEQVIHIRGGLSNGQVNLPGTDIIQPDAVLRNGHVIDAQALALPADQGQGPSPTDESAKNSFPPPSDQGPSDPVPQTTDSTGEPS